MDALTSKEILERHRLTVEAALHDLLPSGPESVRVIDEAARYSLFAGGKRLRPSLLLATCEALGGDVANALPAACAIEMIHTYSLIHDDLPAMDDDELRRGNLTCHVKFGEAMAVLAGDLLATTAFEVIAAHTPNQSMVSSLVLELTRAAGCRGMIGGQVLDLLSENAEPEISRVRDIHRMKTGALLAASVRLGGIAAGCTDEHLDRVTQYGEAIGLAFQIVDDILDVESDAATLGKTVGKDREQAKMTFPACIGLDQSRAEADALVAEAVALIAPLDTKGDLVRLADFIVTRLN